MPWTGGQTPLEKSPAVKQVASSPAKEPAPEPVAIAESAAAPWSVLDAIRVPWTSAAAPAAGAAASAPEQAVAVPEPAAPAPAAAGKNKYRDFENSWTPPEPSPTIVPEEVVKLLLTALKNNDKPTQNAGLRAVLKFSSPSNPITQREPDFFFGMMKTSQYSMLLGNYRTFSIDGTEDLTGTGAGMGRDQARISKRETRNPKPKTLP